MLIERPPNIRFATYISKHLNGFPDLKFDGIILVSCRVCDAPLVSTKLCDWKKHLKSRKHQRNIQHMFLNATFLCDLTFLFSMCDIPFSVLNNKPFHHFWQKYVPRWPLPNKGGMCRKMRDMKTFVREEIKKKLKDKEVWISIDEISNAKGIDAINVVARVLKPNEPSPAYLLASKKLKIVNSETVKQLVMKTLKMMGINSPQVLMLVTGSSLELLMAGDLLRSTYPNLLHIICMVHVLNLVAEEIEKSYPAVDKLISSTKHIFVKPQRYVKIFRSACPGIPLPPHPIPARASTWISAVSYYHQHFEKIKPVVLQLKSRVSQTIAEAQEQFNKPQIEADIHKIHENYTILIDSIERLENSLSSLAESLDIVNNVQIKLQNLKDATGIKASKKLAEILEGNPDYLKLQFINQCLTDKYPVDSLQPFFMFSNITYVNIQRSFSHYSDIFKKRCGKFLKSNREALLMMHVYLQTLKKPILSAIQDDS